MSVQEIQTFRQPFPTAIAFLNGEMPPSDSDWIKYHVIDAVLTSLGLAQREVTTNRKGKNFRYAYRLTETAHDSLRI